MNVGEQNIVDGRTLVVDGWRMAEFIFGNILLIMAIGQRSSNIVF